MKKIKKKTDQRPFSMIYHDFLKGIKNGLLDNHYQIIIFIYLKMFIDSNNQCYPSINTLSGLTKISEKKIRSTLIELENKGIISKENRTRSDGGKSSNLYTLNDYKSTWSAEKDKKEGPLVSKEQEAIKLLKSMGYTVSKEKGLETEPVKAQYQAPKDNIPNTDKDTTVKVKSQDLERYTMSDIKELYDYDAMTHDNPYLQQDINSIMDILHTIMNTTKQTIRIAGQDKPTMVVISKLMKLHKESIMYAVEKYREQTKRVKNPASYIMPRSSTA